MITNRHEGREGHEGVLFHTFTERTQKIMLIFMIFGRDNERRHADGFFIQDVQTQTARRLTVRQSRRVTTLTSRSASGAIGAALRKRRGNPNVISRRGAEQSSFIPNFKAFVSFDSALPASLREKSSSENKTFSGGGTESAYSNKSIAAVLVTSLLLWMAANAKTPPPVNPVAVEIRGLTRSPTRVVWSQDMSDGVDAGVEETHHRLMGFDTEDSRGERAILSDLSNYARPLLTPRGDRVVFTHRRENRVYVVGWDGSGLRCLGRGYAMAVWRDPTNGMEWVYGGTQIPGTTTYHPIQRVPIDQPDRLETIWTKTPVDADNFQLSADGRRACGAFPWPACGMAELPDRDWKKYGDGCWPSLAPDNSALLWIFDGAHRNLTLFREDTDERWVINISHAPGIGGYEVYHPRWSNNPRFMTMTGPYKLGEGDNRIRGGGPDVEIYIGRFDSSFRAIDRWIRVTHNARADFFPDVWIASRKTRDKPDTPIPASTSVPPKVTAWPGNTEGLVFLWENRSKKNEIPEASGPALRSQERRDGEGRVCRAEPRGEARYGRFFEMDLSKGIFIAESGAGELLAAFRKHNQISIEALLVPRQTHRPEFFRIMSFAADTPSGNFMLGQERDRLALRLLTSATNVLRPAIPLCGLTSGVPHHVIISYAPGHLACFLNGEPLNVTNVPADSLDSWIPVGVQLSAGGGSASGGAEPVGLSKLSPYSKELVFGDRDRFWPGTLDHIALYNRVIEAPEARQKYDLVAGRLKHRLPVKPLVVDARLTEASKLPTPAAISPYRRALVVNRYGVVKVIQGSYAEREVMAAHWAILDGRLLDTAPRQKDKLYRMTLEPFDEHPELEGERLIMESGEFLLPLYYEVE